MKKIKIDMEIILYILLFIPFIKMSIFSQYSNIREIIQCISLIIMLIFLLRKNLKIDKFDILTLIFSVYIIVISFIRGNLSFGIAISVIEIFIICKFVKERLKKSNKILTSLYILYSVIAIINFIPIIGKNVTENFSYFLGGKNALSMVLIPTLYFISIYSMVKYRKITIKNLVLSMIIIATMFISGSGTGIVLSVIALISMLLIDKININKKVFFIIYIIILLVILNLPVFNNIEIIRTVVEDYLQKDLTLTGRTEIWSKVINYILDSFLVGYGKGNSIVSSFSNVSECHNMFLEMMLCGGVILLINYMFILKETFSKCDYSKNKLKNGLNNISLIYVFLFFIIGLTESVPFKIEIWIMFAITYSIDNILKNKEKDEINGKDNDIYSHLQ